MSFKVDTDRFRGPIDLLLYLVRRHEVEITEVALAGVTRKYEEYLDVLKEISIDSVGDFIDVAAQLVELKARQVLPRNAQEEEATIIDPRDDLVQRLLMYKQFKDAASLLEDQSARWRDRFPRMADDIPTKKIDISKQPIKEVELWDLVSAFGRVLRDNRPQPKENIIYDETPITTYMKRIHARLVSEGKLSFTDLFSPAMHKSAMVGVFLAMLELTRHHNVQSQQDQLHGEIWIVPAAGFKEELHLFEVDDYNPQSKNFKAGDPGSLVD